MARFIEVRRTITVVDRIPMYAYQDMTEDEAIDYETNMGIEEKLEHFAGYLEGTTFHMDESIKVVDLPTDE